MFGYAANTDSPEVTMDSQGETSKRTDVQSSTNQVSAGGPGGWQLVAAPYLNTPPPRQPTTPMQHVDPHVNAQSGGSAGQVGRKRQRQASNAEAGPSKVMV